MKILHIITSLDLGGAEKVLYNLLLSQESKTSTVVSLTSLGTIGQQLVDQGFDVVALNLNFYNLPLIVFRLYKLIRHHNPYAVQTWLYHADLVGGISAKMAGIRYVVWGIRTTELKSGSYVTGALRKASARLSYWIPSKIVVVAQKALQKHARLGYDTSKMVVIHNGFDAKNLEAPVESINELRRSAFIAESDFVIGCVGRFSQVKGQDIFIKAAGLVLQEFPNVKFLMVGRGLENSNPEVRLLVQKNGWAENFVLLGERPDVAVCLSAMDIFCLPSRSEGFPNVLGEAMLLGVPCVSADAGDASLLGGTDVPIVGVDDPEGLAKKLLWMMSKSSVERGEIGKKLTQRIIDNYSLEVMTSSYQKLYEKLGSEF